MRSEGYGSCRVSLSVCLSVCVSVKSHLTSGASVCPANSARYSAGNEGQNICSVFSETASLRSYGTSCIGAVRHFLSALYARVLLKFHVERGAEFGQ